MSALDEIARLQPRALAMIQANGFVFDFDLGAPVEALDEVGRWQKLAFSLYTDLCEADSLARQALATPPASAEASDAALDAAYIAGRYAFGDEDRRRAMRAALGATPPASAEDH